MTSAARALGRWPFGGKRPTGLSRAGFTATTLATGMAMVLLAASVWAASAELNDVQEVCRVGDQVRVVRLHAQRLLSSLVEAETAQRGFLLTGDARYLAPYETARAALPIEFANLQAALRVRGKRDDRLGGLRDLANGKMAELARTIDLGKAGRVPAALAIVRGNTGERMMESIRARIDGLAPNAEAELALQRERARSIWPMTRVAALGVASSLLFAAVAFGQFRARRGIATALTQLARFRRAFGLSHGLLCQLDGTITFWAEGMEQLYGFTAAEAVGRISHDLLQTQFPIPLPQIQSAVLSQGHWQGELVHRRRDGSVVVVASHWVLQRSESGEPDGMIEVNNDITPFGDAQRERDRQAQLVRTIVEAAPAVIYAKDREGRLTLANQATVALLGMTWAEVEGRTDLELLADPVLAQAVMDNDGRVMRLDQVETVEYVEEDSGAPRTWFSTKTPLHASDGRVCGLVGVSVDITEQKANMARLSVLNTALEAALSERTLVQAALERSEREFRGSFESAAVGKTHSDPLSRRLIRVNRAFAEMLGYAPEDLAGRNSADLLCPEDRAVDEAAYAACLASAEGSFVLEKRYCTRDGRPIWGRASTTIIRAEAGGAPVLAIAVIENIDAQYRSQMALESAKAELEVLVEQRGAAIKQRDLLLREVYHRVKNNLQIVDSFLLMQGRQLADPQAKAAIVSLRARLFALGLVHHQLMGSSNLRTFDIAPFLHDLSANLADAITGGDIDIVVRAAPVDVGLDFAVPLGLLVTELVTNALKHAFPGGKGKIEIALDRAADGTMDLMVCDDGQGYDPAAARTRPGLGAGIVHGLVQQLSGIMSVDTRAGTRVDIHMAQPGVL